MEGITDTGEYGSMYFRICLWLLDSFPRKYVSFGRVSLEIDATEMENVDYSDVQIR